MLCNILLALKTDNGKVWECLCVCVKKTNIATNAIVTIKWAQSYRLRRFPYHCHSAIWFMMMVVGVVWFCHKRKCKHLSLLNAYEQERGNILSIRHHVFSSYQLANAAEQCSKISKNHETPTQTPSSYNEQSTLT